MPIGKIAFVFLFIFLLLFLKTPASAQETFGPICEEGITCTPTQVQPTTPPATSVPATSAPIAQPPVAGTTETTMALLGIGGLFLLAGFGSLALSKRQS